MREIRSIPEDISEIKGSLNDPDLIHVGFGNYEMCHETYALTRLCFYILTGKTNAGIEELTPYALRELIQGIYVETPDKSTGKRRQTIHIKYDGIGFIPLDVLMNGKTA